MQWVTVAEGSNTDLFNLSQYEEKFAEGQKGLLRLDLRVPAPAEAIGTLEERLRAAGVADLQLSSYGSTIDIRFRKGFPFLAVIAAVVLGLIVLAILVVGWQLFKETETPTQIGIIIAIIAVIALIGFLAYKGFIPKPT